MIVSNLRTMLLMEVVFHFSIYFFTKMLILELCSFTVYRYLLLKLLWWVLYGSANDPRTANDPRPEMIPNWTANDRDQKIRNGMDGGIVWIGNWHTWIMMFLSKPSYNYNGLQLAFFSYFQLNFVANYDVMNITTQSSTWLAFLCNSQ